MHLVIQEDILYITVIQGKQILNSFQVKDYSKGIQLLKTLIDSFLLGIQFLLAVVADSLKGRLKKCLKIWMKCFNCLKIQKYFVDMNILWLILNFALKLKDQLIHKFKNGWTFTSKNLKMINVVSQVFFKMKKLIMYL